MKVLLLVGIALGALTGCRDRVGYEQHKTPDGRQIECFVYHAGLKSGISCNWAQPVSKR